jgi:hypothetical protein
MMIFDKAADVSSPSSMVLLPDTDGRSLWYAPKSYRLAKINGRPACTFYRDRDADLGYVALILEPWYDESELQTLTQQMTAAGRALNPMRYLGTDPNDPVPSKATLVGAFPSEVGPVRITVNGGNGGFIQTQIPIAFTTNYAGAGFLAGIMGAGEVGLVFSFSAKTAGATTKFHAHVVGDYSRCYRVFQARTSWSWWLWSGDFQSAWQDLQTSSALDIQIVGSDKDAKDFIYKMAEWFRDNFFKPELSTVTAPSHPDSGIIRTSLRYEAINEGKHFEVTLDELDIMQSVYTCPAFTGHVDLGGHTLEARSEAFKYEALPLLLSTVDARRSGGPVLMRTYDTEVLELVSKMLLQENR